MNTSTYLQIQDVAHRYGDITALEKVSGAVPAQSICGFIGPDGAGKSTLFRIIIGLLRPDSGRVTYTTPKARQPGQVGYMPQQFSMYPDLTVEENLRFFARLYRVEETVAKERYRQLLTFSRLTDFTSRKSENLSGGMKQKLALISVLMYAPPLLILDEPTTGVDPMARTELWEMLHQLQEEGHTILVSTPYMEEAVQCDQVHFMSHGRIIAADSPARLQKQYPYALFALQGPDILRVTERVESLDWITLAYPKGDRLHLGLSDPGITEQEVLHRLAAYIDDRYELYKIPPGMEDVYTALEQTA
ncbi:MAG: ABC transporter ATP-binding protein [Calditrichota bacterium]